jgi:hypothetical protein
MRQILREVRKCRYVALASCLRVAYLIGDSVSSERPLAKPDHKGHSTTRVNLMTALSKEGREEIRNAIQAFRSAWITFTSSTGARNGVLPASLTGDDSPDAWRAFEQSKQVRRREEELICILERVKASTPAVRYQGIIYSIRDAKSTELGSHRFQLLIQRKDEILNLDWPDNVPMQEAQPGLTPVRVVQCPDRSYW